MGVSFEGLVETLFERMPMGVAVFDREMRLVRCNPTWADFAAAYGQRSPEEVLPGTHVFELLPGVEEWAADAATRVLAGETLRFDELRVERGDLRTYWDAVFSPLVEDGEIVGVVEIATDVTEAVSARRELEERVRERTEDIARKQEVADGLHFILDTLNSCCPLEQVLDFIISEARRLLGSEAISVYRLCVSDGLLTMETQRGLDDESIAALEIPVLGGGHVARTIMQRKPMVMPDVTPLVETAAQQLPPAQQAALARVLERFKAILAVPMVVGDEVYGGLTMYYPEPREFSAEDIALAEDLADHLALAIENARLRESAELTAASEERSRLARDLHDAVTQTLFSASLIAEVLPQLWERDPQEGRRRLAQLRDLTRGALAEMRALLLELRPSTLAEVPLPDLLRQLAEATRGRSGVEIGVRVEGERDVAPDVRIALYRIAQEALNNVAKHAGATRAEVVLRQDEDGVGLVIEDDGRGFVSRTRAGDSLGLEIMRERADSVGATLAVESEPGQGTRVTVGWRDGEKE